MIDGASGRKVKGPCCLACRAPRQGKEVRRGGAKVGGTSHHEKKK